MASKKGTFPYLYYILITCFLVGGPAAAKPPVVKLENRVTRHIKKLEAKHPLKRWAKQLNRLKKDLDALKSDYYANQSQGLEIVPYQSLQKFEARLGEVKTIRKKLVALIGRLETKSIVEQTFPKAVRIRDRTEAGARARLLSSLHKNENRRCRKKQKLLQRCDLLLNWFEAWQADWMLQYARKTVFQALKNEFHTHWFAENARVLMTVTQKVNQISKELSRDPLTAYGELEFLKSKLPAMSTSLNSLKNALTIDTLYKQILAKAETDGIPFSAKALKKIETLLPSLSKQNIHAVDKRRQRWLNLDYKLSQSMEKALENQGELELRKARQAQYNRELSARLLSKDSDIVLDKSLDKVLSKKPGKLRTSRVGSARNEHKVKVDSFSDKLVQVEKINLEIPLGSPEFERIYDDPKEAQSLYMFMAEQGNADKNDLREFVHEVALLSFGGTEEFLSYRLPRKWAPGKRIRWQSVKNEEKEIVQNREYSYIDLVTEAHRTRPEQDSYQYIKTIYIPANMILIFQPGGRVKRYQTFADIRKLRIKPADLKDGRLFYKFLNFSVSGEFITLNGIDHEIKMATLN